MIALNRSRQIILVSMFSATVMVAIGAIDHLVSVDASILKPLNVPTLEMGKTEPDLTSEVNKSQVAINPTRNPTLAAKQTDRERQNVALAKLQDEQWLIQQEKIKNAKNALKKKTLAKTLATSPAIKPMVAQRSPLKISSIDVDKANSTNPSPSPSSMRSPQPDVQFVSAPIGDTAIIGEPETSEIEQLPTMANNLANNLMGTTKRRPNSITTTIQPDLDAWSQSPAQMTPQTVPNSGDE
jgi:hypothetical protein